jgi:hypothetical protein
LAIVNFAAACWNWYLFPFVTRSCQYHKFLHVFTVIVSPGFTEQHT